MHVQLERLCCIHVFLYILGLTPGLQCLIFTIAGLFHCSFFCFYLSVRYIEGTVSQLLEDKFGTVVGVQYRDKATGNVQVYSIFLNTYSNNVLLQHSFFFSAFEI